MKKALATLAAISMIATPIYAAQAQNNTMTSKSTKTTTKASKSVAKQAKAEGESTKTEAKEVRHHAKAKHHYGKYSRCKPSHMGKAKSHHKTMHKAAAKTTTTPKKG
jgi:Ni/Co efflux regulator RcnB